MSMSKQDFIALADTLRELHTFIGEDETTPQIKQGRYDQWQRTVNALADFCRAQNSNFMRDRWLGYIAGENGKSSGRVKKAA